MAKSVSTQSESSPIGSLHSDRAEIRRLRAEISRLRSAIVAHRESWQSANGTNSSAAYPSDLKLWEVLDA